MLNPHHCTETNLCYKNPQHSVTWWPNDFCISTLPKPPHSTLISNPFYYLVPLAVLGSCQPCLPLHKACRFWIAWRTLPRHLQKMKLYSIVQEGCKTGACLLKDWVPKHFRIQDDRQKSPNFQVFWINAACLQFRCGGRLLWGVCCCTDVWGCEQKWEKFFSPTLSLFLWAICIAIGVCWICLHNLKSLDV